MSLRSLLRRAAEEAEMFRATQVGVDHIGLALSVEAAGLIASLGVDARRWRDLTIYFLAAEAGRRAATYNEGVLPCPQPAPTGLTDQAAGMFEDARSEAQRGGSDEPDFAHVLIALLRVQEPTASATGRYLGLTPAAVRAAVGLPAVHRVLADGADEHAGRRPSRSVPIVLLGGGSMTGALPAALDYAAQWHKKQRRGLRVAVFGASIHESDRAMVERMRSLGVDAVDLNIKTRDDAKRFGGPLDTDVFYVTGGDVALKYDRIWASSLGEAVVAFAEAGGIVMGHSSGAKVWGEFSLSNYLNEGDREPFRTLGWLPGTVVETHHLPAPDDVKLREALAAFPDKRIIAVAQDGAVLLGSDGSLAELYPGRCPSLVVTAGRRTEIATRSAGT